MEQGGSFGRHRFDLEPERLWSGKREVKLAPKLSAVRGSGPLGESLPCELHLRPTEIDLFARDARLVDGGFGLISSIP